MSKRYNNEDLIVHIFSILAIVGLYLLFAYIYYAKEMLSITLFLVGLIGMVLAPFAIYCYVGTLENFFIFLLTIYEKVKYLLLSFPERVKGVTMTLGYRLKTLLNSDLKVLVEAGYLSESLETTEKGRMKLINLLFDNSIKELANAAKEDLDKELK